MFKKQDLRKISLKLYFVRVFMSSCLHDSLFHDLYVIPFLCEAAPNFRLSFSLCVAPVAASFRGAMPTARCANANKSGNPPNALASLCLCGSFILIQHIYGYDTLRYHTELI